MLVCRGSWRAPVLCFAPNSPAWGGGAAARTLRGCRSGGAGDTGPGGRAVPSRQAEPWRPGYPARQRRRTVTSRKTTPKCQGCESPWLRPPRPVPAFGPRPTACAIPVPRHSCPVAAAEPPFPPRSEPHFAEAQVVGELGWSTRHGRDQGRAAAGMGREPHALPRGDGSQGSPRVGG